MTPRRTPPIPTECGQEQGFGEELAADLPAVGTEPAAQADLAAAFLGRDDDGVASLFLVRNWHRSIVCEVGPPGRLTLALTSALVQWKVILVADVAACFETLSGKDWGSAEQVEDAILVAYWSTESKALRTIP